MWIEQAMQKLSDSESYSRNELQQIFLTVRSDLSDSAFRWILYRLVREHKLFKADYDSYGTVEKKFLPEYLPVYSNEADTLMRYIEKKYPDLCFVVFESTLLNEFLNQQIAQNTIYLQVDKNISSYIFDEVKENYPGTVLLNPDKNELIKYWKKDCLIVLDLISQAPLSKSSPHKISIEKMLVDIIAEKSISSSFSSSELPFIFGNALKSYQTDRHKIIRYAGRRGKLDKVIGYMGGAA